MLASRLEWTPREIEELTMWELAAYAEGLHRAKPNAKPEAMSDDDFESLLEKHNITAGHI